MRSIRGDEICTLIKAIEDGNSSAINGLIDLLIEDNDDRLVKLYELIEDTIYKVFYTRSINRNHLQYYFVNQLGSLFKIEILRTHEPELTSIAAIVGYFIRKPDENSEPR